MKKITKAVIPAAGFGTRFLPVTKSVCKEMLPIVDKPTLQYIVEEAVAAGIEDILVHGQEQKNPGGFLRLHARIRRAFGAGREERLFENFPRNGKSRQYVFRAAETPDGVC